MRRSLLVFALIAPFAMPPVAGAQSAAESAAHGVRQVTVTPVRARAGEGFFTPFESDADVLSVDAGRNFGLG